MSETMVGRLYAVCGIAYAVVMFFAVTLIGDLPDSGAGSSDAETLAFYADSGKRVPVIVGAYLVGIAGLLLACFIAHLYRRMIEVDHSSTTARIALIAGIVLIALLFAGAALRVSVAGAISIDGQEQPGADVSRIVPYTGWFFIRMHGAIASGAMIIAVSLFSLRRAFLPAWLAWGGVLAGAVQPLTDTLFPNGMTMVWALVVGIVMLQRPGIASEVGNRNGQSS